MKTQGIYIIFNRISKHVYIGSSINIASRLRKHLNMLKGNRHDNQYLQNSFNKHGEQAFKLSVLERVSRAEDLLQREQFWIDKVKNKYNILKKAGNSIGFKHSPEAKIKLSKLASQRTGAKNHWFRKRLPQHVLDKCRAITSSQFQGSGNPFWGQHHTNETKELLSKKFTGRKMSNSFCHQQQGNERGAKTYQVTHPDGTTVTVKNLKKFCRENNLQPANAFQAVTKQKLYKGFTFRHLRDVDK